MLLSCRRWCPREPHCRPQPAAATSVSSARRCRPAAADVGHRRLQPRPPVQMPQAERTIQETQRRGSAQLPWGPGYCGRGSTRYATSCQTSASSLQQSLPSRCVCHIGSIPPPSGARKTCGCWRCTPWTPAGIRVRGGRWLDTWARCTGCRRNATPARRHAGAHSSCRRCLSSCPATHTSRSCPRCV